MNVVGTEVESIVQEDDTHPTKSITDPVRQKVAAEAVQDIPLHGEEQCV